MDDRPGRYMLHMATANLWSKRSVCKRAQVGCIITSHDLRRILSFGYNGPAKGLPHDRCNGQEGRCGCLHAEQNAVALVDSTIMRKIAFCTTLPCEICAQLLIQANITEVFYELAYRNLDSLEIFKKCQVVCSPLIPK